MILAIYFAFLSTITMPFSHPHLKIYFSLRIYIIHTHLYAPKAIFIAECWVHPLRVECLDYILSNNQNHLRRVLKEYVNYYNHYYPHQAIDQHSPFQVPITIEMDLYKDAISWEASSTSNIDYHFFYLKLRTKFLHHTRCVTVSQTWTFASCCACSLIIQ
jgi:hypothetical protein